MKSDGTLDPASPQLCGETVQVTDGTVTLESGVLVVTCGGRLVGVDLLNGVATWRRDSPRTTQRFTAVGSFGDGNAWALTSERIPASGLKAEQDTVRVEGLNPVTGKMLWDHELTRTTVSGGAGMVLVVPSANGMWTAVGSDGRVLWSHDSGDTFPSLAADGTRVVFAGPEPSVRDALSGEVIIADEVDASWYSSLGVIQHGNDFTRVDLRDGSVLGDGKGEPLREGFLVREYVGRNQDLVYVAGDGRERWRISGSVLGSFEIDELGDLVVQNTSAQFIVVDLESGTEASRWVQRNVLDVDSSWIAEERKRGSIVVTSRK